MKRERDASGDEDVEIPKAKKVNIGSPIEHRFRSDLFEPATLDGYTKSYANSKPYKHAVISSLIEPSLLRNVREEIIANLHFTPKETDIYKIHQSGDLANLDGLEDSSLSKLPSLLALRDALYSTKFRKYLSHITGAGKLSGKKTDMAINVYTPGCHLLCHDDVIGSRRISYILYLTDPDKPWREEWGGALRLYPTTTKTTKEGDEIKVPTHAYSLSIPPAFDQLSFFAVQPGESYHDVEEVYHGASESENEERTRMAISGWFHIPQEGEDGYEEGLAESLAVRSSLSQLEGHNDEFDTPQQNFVNWTTEPEINGDSKGKAVATDDEEEDDALLTELELEFLLKYVSPSFLTPDMADELELSFTENSLLQLDRFLNTKFADDLKEHIQSQDGSNESQPWSIAEPPFKHRYCFLQPKPDKPTNTPIEELVNILFPSQAFRKWLALATGLDPSNLVSHNILARRFRKGHDYALASSFDGDTIINDHQSETAEDASQPSTPEDDEQGGMRLELTFNMTPSSGWEPPTPAEEDGNPPSTNGATENGSSSGGPEIIAETEDQDFDSPGGEEVYMAADNDDEDVNTTKPTSDPAVYQSSKSSSHHNHSTNGESNEDQQEDEDDGILLSTPPAWNTLSIVLRDKGTLRFVKYVSQRARGDRWDIKGEIGCWGVGGEDLSLLDDDDEEEEDELDVNDEEEFEGFEDDE